MWTGALERLAPGYVRFVVVVDTDAILSSVDNDVRRNHRSRLLRMTDTGTARLFAAPHVYEECYRRLPRVAPAGAAASRYLRKFEEEYLPRIRFADPGTRSPADEAAAAVGALDPADEPTARLAWLLAPVIVLSGDKHLRRPGLAPADWRRTAGAVADVAHADASTFTATAAVMAPTAGAVSLVRWGAHRLGVHPAVITAVVAGASWAWLADARRRADVKTRLNSRLAGLGNRLADAYSAGAAGAESARSVEVVPPDDPPLEQQVAAHLARAPEPLTATAVRNALRQSPHCDERLNVQQVLAVLRRLPAATEEPRHRWRVGVRREPMLAGSIAEVPEDPSGRDLNALATGSA